MLVSRVINKFIYLYNNYKCTLLLLMRYTKNRIVLIIVHITNDFNL